MSERQGPRVVAMGVTGSGKSTVGAALAALLGVPFQDGDALHSQANVDKMHDGHPLTDEDRWPWLARCGDWLADRPAGVLACSALKRAYRDVLREHAPGVVFLALDGSRELLRDRLAHRHGHFMPPELLDSQLATYERLGADEEGRAVDISQTSAAIVQEYAGWLAAQGFDVAPRP